MVCIGWDLKAHLVPPSQTWIGMPPTRWHQSDEVWTCQTWVLSMVLVKSIIAKAILLLLRNTVKLVFYMYNVCKLY